MPKKVTRISDACDGNYSKNNSRCTSLCAKIKYVQRFAYERFRLDASSRRESRQKKRENEMRRDQEKVGERERETERQEQELNQQITQFITRLGMVMQ